MRRCAPRSGGRWGTTRLRGKAWQSNDAWRLAGRFGAGKRDYADLVSSVVRLPGNRATPAPVRGAGLIVAVQGAAGLVMAAVLAIRRLGGADQRGINGLGTALWFALVGAAVLAAGFALISGRRWGRGLAIFTQLLLLPVAWYLTTGSDRPHFGIPLGALALTALIALFVPAATRWAAAFDQRDPAKPANRDPDSR